MQFIQQDSYAALNPVRTIYQSLYAPIRMHNPKWSKKQIDTKIDELMTLIGLQPAAQFLSKYPHQLSGGQRQRILMARAISLDPKLIVADEPVSMIDVSLRLSLLNLMSELNERLGIAFVYITHDLSTARYIARRGRLAVMYLGEIMEEGAMDVVLSHPRHPYTRALLKAVPVPDPDARSDEKLPLKSMELSGIEDRGEGCPFAPRCPYMTEQCERPVDYVVTEGVRIKRRGQMNKSGKLAFRLGLGLMLIEIRFLLLVPVGSAEFWVCVITAVADGIFCIGLLAAAIIRRK